LDGAQHLAFDMRKLPVFKFVRSRLVDESVEDEAAVAQHQDPVGLSRPQKFWQ
jgi:hypothetical protein